MCRETGNFIFDKKLNNSFNFEREECSLPQLSVRKLRTAFIWNETSTNSFYEVKTHASD